MHERSQWIRMLFVLCQRFSRTGVVFKHVSDNIVRLLTNTLIALLSLCVGLAGSVVFEGSDAA